MATASSKPSATCWASVAVAAIAASAVVYRQINNKRCKKACGKKGGKACCGGSGAAAAAPAPAAAAGAAAPAARAAGAHHDFSNAGFGTRVLHVGQSPDPVSGAVAVPITTASTFAQRSPGVPSGQDFELSYFKGFEYSRTGNPTRAAYEIAVASAESGKYAVAFSSGSAATSAVLHLLQSGEHVIVTDDVYGGTQRYFRRIARPAAGMDFSFVDFSNLDNVRAAIKPNTRLIWMETPTNPTLKIADIAAVAALAKEHNILVAVDNTFMSAYFQRPLELGADMVVNSVTKYVNGHSDVVGGFVATSSDDLLTRLRFIQNGIGAVPSPFDCYMVLRGLKTLHLRMQRHGENAQQVAEFLEAHAFVERVLYPGLASHPQHEIAKRQMSGFGGMITFYIKGGLEGARAFLETTKLFILAESLGAVESLCESPALMTHASVPAEDRAKLGIADNLIRLSVGVENIEDLLADLAAALTAAQKAIEGQ